MIDLRGTAIAADERAWLESPLVGGVILFSRNFENLEQLTELVTELHAIRTPPLLVTVDHEGGRVQRFKEPFFRLPPFRALGRLYDEDPQAALKVAASFGWLMAAELRAVGIDMSFTPCVDRDLGLSEVIGDRALHSDARTVAALARRIVAGAKRAAWRQQRSTSRRTRARAATRTPTSRSTVASSPSSTTISCRTGS
jgi:beta-N-acetylhexosaminidase